MRRRSHEDTLLREVDINVTAGNHEEQAFKCDLPMPKVSRQSQKRLQHERVEARLREEVPLPFHEVHRRVRAFLELEFNSMEAYARLRHQGITSSLPRRFHELLGRADADAQRTITPLREGWSCSEANVSFSSRIMDFLHVKRAVLRQGLEFPFQDLIDWLLLAALLGECVTGADVAAFACDLGPSHRAKVEQVLTSQSLCENSDLSAAKLYLALKHVRPVLDDASCITGYYFNTAFDEFIEDDEKLVGTTLFQHSDINSSMRAKLCEWLYETYAGTTVHRPVREETYFLGAALLDRFLAIHSVTRSNFLLCGCAAILLASKHEEIYSPTIQRVVSDAQMTFTETSLIEMEKCIAATLDFSLGVPTISNIANTMLVEQDPPATAVQRSVLSYLLVALSIHTHHGQYHQSLLAAAAVHVSRNVCGVPTGTPSERVQSIMPCVRDAVDALSRGGSRIFIMFAQKRLHEASILLKNFAEACPSHAAGGF